MKGSIETVGYGDAKCTFRNQNVRSFVWVTTWQGSQLFTSSWLCPLIVNAWTCRNWRLCGQSMVMYVCVTMYDQHGCQNLLSYLKVTELLICAPRFAQQMVIHSSPYKNSVSKTAVDVLDQLRLLQCGNAPFGVYISQVFYTSNEKFKTCV